MYVFQPASMLVKRDPRLGMTWRVVSCVCTPCSFLTERRLEMPGRFGTYELFLFLKISFDVEHVHALCLGVAVCARFATATLDPPCSDDFNGCQTTESSTRPVSEVVHW